MITQSSRGFLEWMSYIHNVYQSNKPSMERALTKLSDYDNEKNPL